MSDFNVMDMLDDYAADNEIDVADIFKKTEVDETKSTTQELNTSVNDNSASIETPKKAIWTPDAELIKDMPELNKETGVEINPETYNKIPELKNGSDESVKENSGNEIDEMKEKLKKIEEAKIRHNIKNLHIPQGQYQVDIMLAASDNDNEKAQEQLDAFLNNIEKTFPSWIEYNDNYTPEKEQAKFTHDPDPDPDEVTDAEDDPDKLKIAINKRDSSNFAWTEDELNKIRKARVVELNIVDGRDIDFGNIKNVATNAVDDVLSKFKRKTNDVPGVLPASKYRATFSGLSYPESIDLITAGELNNYDSKMKMWTLAFNHIHNQSIGPWEEYREYIDPNTGKITRIDMYETLPDGIDKTDVWTITKFMDFMRKTSYLDLDFIIWKILCASSLDSELITITCRATKDNGQPCNKVYDWIYRPAELLNESKINVGILNDMKEAGEAQTADKIKNVYASSPVNGSSYVKLPNSGLMAVYGHANAYEYMNDMYSLIEENIKAATDENATDPSIVTKAMIYTAIPVIKGFIVPGDDGQYSRIVGVENIIKVLGCLDEVDWGVVSELHSLMTKPYAFEYVMKDVVCPDCHAKSDIRLSGVDRLLFIRAQTLRSVQVKLTRN